MVFFLCFETLVKYQILNPGINPKSHVNLYFLVRVHPVEEYAHRMKVHGPPFKGNTHSQIALSIIMTCVLFQIHNAQFCGNNQAFVVVLHAV